MSDAISQLHVMMQALPTGRVEETGHVEMALSAAWDKIAGTEAESTHASKLVGRTEQMVWNPPVLSFVIERHGGTVHGSSRAKLHKWNIDLEKRIAVCNPDHSYRQLTSMSPRFDVKAPAREIAALIVEKKTDSRLRWRESNRLVQVVISEVVPDTAATQTITGRRKRFRKLLTVLLAPHGWQPAVGKAANTYVRSDEALAPNINSVSGA